MNYTPGEQWPRAEAADYFIKQKRMNVVRLSLLWELMQPILGGPLAVAQTRGIQTQIGRIAGLGAYVIIEPHIYGRRTEGGAEHIIGEGPIVTIDHFSDFWRKVAAQYSGPMILYSLMNEPHDQNSGKLVEVINGAIAAIRSTGATGPILVPGNNWTSRTSWRRGSANFSMMADIVDPLNNWIIDYHCYFDEWSAGQKATIEKGFINDVAFFSNWLGSSGRKAFVGEFGCAADVESLKALQRFLDHIEANRECWAGWAYFAGGGWWKYDHMLRLDPYASKWDPHNVFAKEAQTWEDPRPDMPQMRTLMRYLPHP
ncbi:cellulase family glycosylhydrolase [Microvirga sp. HBU67558]|nr:MULTISPECIES: cellulase family glycosylhydrolase [unclassified Microvirga]MBQ0819061.1 cellulase family glycosylhydrolase [Microvirga sp. HBU67558]